MAKQKILNSKKQIGKKTVTITETIEREYDVKDLKQIEKNYLVKIERIEREVYAFSKQKETYIKELEDIRNYINRIEGDE